MIKSNCSESFNLNWLLTDTIVIRKNSMETQAEPTFLNRGLNRGCLFDMFSLRFSGSKFLIYPRRKFRVRKIFSST